MTKNDQIIIDNWQKGMAESPLLGFSFMSNIDIASVPGVAMSSLQASALSGSLTGPIKWIVKSPINGNVYGLSSDNKLYSINTSANTFSYLVTCSTGSGNGMVLWQDYIFVFCDAGVIDTYGPISGSPTRTAAWADVGNNNLGMGIVGTDNVVYFCNGRYLASLQNVSVGGTTLGTLRLGANSQELDLPDGYVANCLEELGDFMMIGTYYGSSLMDKKEAVIFPWDLVNKPYSYSTPIRLAENGVTQMKNINNRLYFTTGGKPKLYVTNGTTTEVAKHLRNISLGLDKYVSNYTGAITQHNNSLLFGVSGGNTTSSDTGFGTYAFDYTNGVLTYADTPGGMGEYYDGTVVVTSLFSLSSDTHLIAWKRNTTYGIDKVGRDGNFSSYTQIVSQMYEIGTAYNKKTFERIEIQLADKLLTGQGVTIDYRENLTDSWTTVGQMSYATVGAKKSWVLPFSVQLESLQLRISLGSASASAPVKLKYLRISNG